MNAEEFLKQYATPKVFERVIEHDGNRVTFHFRRITGDEMDELNLALYGEDGKVDRDRFLGNVSRQLAKSLCREDGSPVTTADAVGKLDGSLRSKLQAALEEINGVREKKDREAGSEPGSD